MGQGNPTPTPQAAALPKRIIILESTTPSGNQFKIILWARPPAARVPYWASVAPSQSAWVDASQQETQAIKNGEVVEKVESAQGNTVAQVEQSAETKWKDFDEFVQSYNPWSLYASFWDGSAWVVVGLP